MDLISIIVPVYNTEKYLKECLESILNQTYQQLEIIIVNDGSTDHSEVIIEEYRARDLRIISVKQKNQGLSGARNTGLKHMHGKYVTFVDSDDIIAGNMIRVLYEEIIANDADIVYTTLRRFKLQPNIDINKLTYKKVKCDSENALRYYFRSKLGNVCGGLFRSELFRTIRFPRNLIYEDNLPKTKLLLQSKCTVFLEAGLYYYRITRNSITNQKFSEKKFDILIIGQRIEEFLRKKDKNFAAYKKEFYEMIYQIVYCNMKDAIQSGYQDFQFRKKGISLLYLYKLLLIGLISDYKKCGADFFMINQAVMKSNLKFIFKFPGESK